MIDLKKEIRKLPESDPGAEPVHVGIVCPGTYPVALASLGFQTVHRIAHSHPGIIAHRITLESTHSGKHKARTLEESLEIKSLDALLISCSFELDYINLVRILHSAGINPLRRKRKSLPMLIFGGIAVTGNPEPIAGIADAIAIGDAEIILPGILDDFIDLFPLLRGARFLAGRDKLYESWDNLPGVYVPALWEDKKGGFENPDNRSIVQAYIENADSYPSFTPVVAPDGAYGAKNLISISSGCLTGCRFCMLSHITSPEPVRSFESIIENARIFSPDEASVGLVSSRVSDHPEIVHTINTLADFGYSVSVSSLKVSSTTPDLLNALHRAGTSGVTFAPEHGSERIRRILGKPYSYDEVRDRVAWSFDCGISNVKLYFLTGFEEETDDDLDSTSEFIISLCRDTGLEKRPGTCRLGISIAPFVPKPGTPFQRRAMQDDRTLKRKLKRITSSLKGIPRLDCEYESPRLSILQGIFSVGNRTLEKYLEDISKNDLPVLSAWERAVEKFGDSPLQLVLKLRPVDEWKIPWGFI
ncbi:MAG TPA: radical SAM protein, partial [Firmicutes bacterium]|nr:radical SAM protein [Bacillota bacterium]